MNDPADELSRRPTRAFLSETLLAFSYPLRIRGVAMIAAAGILFGIIGGVWPLATSGSRQFARAVGILIFLAVAAGCYVANYLCLVIRHSAGGERAMPEWPLVEYYFRESLATLFWGLIAGAASFAPLAIYRIAMRHQGAPPAETVVFALRAVGCFYLPMALLGVVLLRTPVALSPHVVLPALAKVPGSAAIAGVLLWSTWTAGLWAHEAVETHLAGSNPLLVTTLARAGMFAAELYMLFVVARIIGITHRIYGRQLGWLERQ